MKTFIRGVLTTVLVFTFVLIPTVIYSEKAINNDLIGGYLKSELTNQMTEAITEDIENLSEEEYHQIKSEIKNDKEINALVKKYSSRIIEDLSKEKVEDISLEEDIKSILHSNKDTLERVIGREISNEQLDQMIDTVLQDNENTYQQIIQQARQEMPREAQNMIDSYNTITSKEFIVIAVIISVIAIVIIALLKKPYYKWIVNVGIAGIIAALFVSLIGGSIALLVGLVVKSVDETISISAKPMLITAVIMLASSLLLIIVNNILDKKRENKNAIS